MFARWLTNNRVVVGVGDPAAICAREVDSVCRTDDFRMLHGDQIASGVIVLVLDLAAEEVGDGVEQAVRIVGIQDAPSERVDDFDRANVRACRLGTVRRDASRRAAGDDRDASAAGDPPPIN